MPSATRSKQTPPSRTKTPSKPRSRPLVTRPGARFDCFGDGLCCSDIHALGPVTGPEKRHLDVIAPGSLVRHEDLREWVFETQAEGPRRGSCVHRSERGCELHARLGPQAKPGGCMRFPFGLISTPDGGRITTEHRCPCRTLGDRPLLEPKLVEPSLRDSAGRLQTNGAVGPKVPLDPERKVQWATYRELEADMLASLIGGADPLRVFEAEPFGKLEGMRWNKVASEIRAERDGTQYGEAQVWFGNAIRAARKREKLEVTARPWSWSFDIAEARPGRRTSAEVFGDWLADAVWSLDWYFAHGSFIHGQRELATLYVIAAEIANVLIQHGVRPDRAAAEGITIVELTSQAQVWSEVQDAMLYA